MRPDLASLSNDARHYWNTRYGEDSAGLEFEAVNLSVWCSALEMAKRLNWKLVPGVHIFRNAARLAVGQHMNVQATCICIDCDGTAGTDADHCRGCSGTRRMVLTHFVLRRIIGCPGPEYAAHWIPRLQAITEILEGYDREIAALDRHTEMNRAQGSL